MTFRDPSILVISREFPPHVLGGLSYHLGNLYSSLEKQGCEVTVLAGTCDQTTADESAPCPQDVAVERIPFGSQRGHHIRFPLALKRRLRTFDIDSYDVVVAHTPLPFGFDIPMVGKYHDCIREEKTFQESELPTHEQILSRIVEPTRRFVDQKSLHVVDVAVFNSDLTRRVWRKHYDLPSKSIVHYNGVDTDLFRPYPSEEDSYLLFVGGSERKGLSTVLNFAETASYPIRIVGPSKVDSENVQAMGRVSQPKLARLYSGAIATIHPAKFEAFGNVVLESLACGTPVVTTENCGASAILSRHCGEITDDLAQGVDQVVNKRTDPTACRNIAQQYSWDNVAERTFELLCELIE
ncbi:glycosyltransferase family 4 protein [Natrinema pallidum]|uniref:Glycosyltransferase n=1 Tax=Natrinema pallidum DSM 3751 TaxID=1227495 RepID=L9Z658_9EURY|nr:glycosyltransferase family 4 protein [Natrinema pallidum]ELY81152.1 glycosyltransferase [Natrinema pallidum DSM 3751]